MMPVHRKWGSDAEVSDGSFAVHRGSFETELWRKDADVNQSGVLVPYRTCLEGRKRANRAFRPHAVASDPTP